MPSLSFARVVRPFVVCLSLSFVVLACGGQPRTADPGGVKSSDVITIDEILTTKTQNAYDAVRRLRPAFLQSRGPITLLERDNAPSQPLVYLDNRRYGDIESLKTITVDGIYEIRYLSPNQAQLKWGMNHAAGVIHVTTMSGKATSRSYRASH